ncbi:MAG: branched-chain amino acid aminotransferase [Halobacteriovoraceae bacterium]|nr:branched-chain amino acid aminotransferase [Halobacteriovoraceae bacterium]
MIDEKKIKEFKYPENPSFGAVHVPVCLWFDIGFKESSPEEINLTSQTDFLMSCFTSALHYGQSIFEGLKAYYTQDGRIGIFRPDAHAKRLKKSAKIMGMPEINEDVIEDCIVKFVETCKDIVPREKGHSLYIRPIMYANDPLIKVGIGEKYRFAIMGSIVGPYFKSGISGTKIFCNKDFVRAFPKGTGEAKTSANYALSLPGLKHAQKLGFEQVLYLDAMTKKNIEELGGMNFFMIKENKIITPPLSGTILSGITRDSILKIAQYLNIEFEERVIPLIEILQNASTINLFASGTAATIAPISKLGVETGITGEVDTYSFNSGSIIDKLYQTLIDCQLNRNPLSENWIRFI